MRIQIIGVPFFRSAPEEIRRCWLGIELESFAREGVTDKDVLTGTKKLGGYMVEGKVAFSALEAHNKRAYDWWVENHSEIMNRILVFRPEVCKEIP